jgi:hypothetical protein
MAYELCAFLSENKIADLLNALCSLDTIVNCISLIAKANRMKGVQIWELINKEVLAKRATRYGHAWTVFAYIYRLWDANESIAEEFCGLLNSDILASILDDEDDGFAVGQILLLMLRSNEVAGRNIWRLLNKEELAGTMTGDANEWKGRLCVKDIFQVAPDIAKQLAAMLDLDSAMSSSESQEDVMQLRHYLDNIKPWGWFLSAAIEAAFSDRMSDVEQL